MTEEEAVLKAFSNGWKSRISHYRIEPRIIDMRYVSRGFTKNLQMLKPVTIYFKEIVRMYPGIEISEISDNIWFDVPTVREN